MWSSSLQVWLAVAVRKRGMVSLGQEDTQQGKVRGRETLQHNPYLKWIKAYNRTHLSITDREERE